jgi:glycosyltransferase involved in cell wall biosynthesis
MSQAGITVLITNYNTLDYVKLSLYALSKLTKNVYKVIINDNGSRPKELEQLKKLSEFDSKVRVNYRNCEKRPSYAHAEALDILISMSDTRYTVVLDSDCVFLLDNWDEMLISRLNDKVKIIGTPQTKGRSGLKPDNFPFQFAVLFETDTYKRLGISCIPRNMDKGEDTCWEWKPKFTEAGYGSEIFIAKNTRDFQGGPLRSVICDEYYLADGRLIASHLGRGSSGGSVKYYHRWFYNLPVAASFIRKAVAAMQKRDWINLCRKIVDDQAKGV